MSPGLSVLSIGYTRGLWQGPEAEDVIRLRGYARQLERYTVLVNSYRCHRLRPLALAPGFEAIPTDATGPLHSFARMLRLGSEQLSRARYDLVQGQDPYFTGLAALILGHRYGAAVNVCVYGPNVFDSHWRRATRGSALLGPLGAWVLRRADGVQVDGRLTARRLEEAGIPGHRIAVKPMVPANLEEFFAVDRWCPSPDARLRLLYVGRLEPQKNLGLLAAAFRRAASEVPVELEIVGHGSSEANLRAALAQETAAGLVHWAGVVPRNTIADVFRRADCLVLTSHYEGFPRVFVEAGAAALPVVTTAVSGADEVILEGKSGWVVPLDDVAAFATRIVGLAREPSLRYEAGLAARDHVKSLVADHDNEAEQLGIWSRLVTGKSRR